MRVGKNAQAQKMERQASDEQAPMLKFFENSIPG